MKTNQALMGVLRLRADVHVLEEIAECERVDVLSEKEGGRGPSMAL